MTSFVRESIEYSGIVADNELPVLPMYSCFNQFIIREKIRISSGKATIRHLLKVHSTIKILHKKMQNTPETISEDGSIMTSRRLIVEGSINHRLEYISEDPEQTLHAYFFESPFSSFIVLPKDCSLGTPVHVDSYIMDIYSKVMNKENVFINVIILLTAEF